MRLRAKASSSLRIPAKAAPERFGPYSVLESLGEGGMASVHRATRDGQTVALKRLRTDLSEDLNFVEAFVQEAKLARLIRHPNIARAYELGKHAGTYFIAMELVSGPTLQAVMQQARDAAGAIPVPIVVEILIQLCDALDHAHNLCGEDGRPLGLIHRDVSPANVIVSELGVIKLIDFGIAKAAGSRVHTEAGFIKGKLSYVAPEYTLGQLDARADLFAVGVIAHELLTGQRLFDATTDVSTVHRIREQPIQPPSRHDPSISLELDDIVITALQRDPSLRWQNAAAMRRALEGVADDLGGRTSAATLLRWTKWAFACPPRRDSLITQVVDDLALTTPARRVPARGRVVEQGTPRDVFDHETVPSPRVSLTMPVAAAASADSMSRATVPLDAGRRRALVALSRDEVREPTATDVIDLIGPRRFGEAIASRGDRGGARLWWCLAVLVVVGGVAAGLVWGDQVVAALGLI